MRRLAAALGLLALFLVACTSGGDGAVERQNEANGQPPTTVAAPTTVPEPTAAPEPTAVPEPTAEVSSGDGDLGALLNPLSLISGPVFSRTGPAGLPAGTREADPALKAALLTLEDLPPGHDVLPPGDMSFAFDTDEGSMRMAMSIFAQGGGFDSFPESMVISGVITGSGELLDESFAELKSYSESGDLEREIEEAMGPSDLLGIGIEEVRVLDASGLGDGGFGMHMVMTMDLEDLGVPMPSEADFLSEGLAFDMYVFWRGEHMLMVMSMWRGSGPAPVDAAGLAEMMDGRAEEAF